MTGLLTVLVFEKSESDGHGFKFMAYVKCLGKVVIV